MPTHIVTNHTKFVLKLHKSYAFKKKCVIISMKRTHQLVIHSRLNTKLTLTAKLLGVPKTNRLACAFPNTYPARRSKTGKKNSPATKTRANPSAKSDDAKPNCPAWASQSTTLKRQIGSYESIFTKLCFNRNT